MKDVPQWIEKFLDEGKINCGRCNKKFGASDLVSVGIQEGAENPDDDMLALGVYCEDCHEMTIIELKEMSLMDLAFEIIESDKRQDKDEKKNIATKKKSKITDEEVRQAKLFLSAMKYNTELLEAMGMSPEEINKYEFKKRND